jgi:Ca2+-binding RTX toxin-like protein
MAVLHGTDDHDYQRGTYDADSIYGYGGSDIQSGSAGNDNLVGGTGQDYLTGGSDIDLFVFFLGHSPSTTREADFIVDWDVRYDFIQLPVAGTASNYAEAPTSFTNMEGARHQVESSPTLGDHVFLYNSYTDTGYLLSSLDGDFIFETGIVIMGAGLALDMDWSDIIAGSVF